MPKLTHMRKPYLLSILFCLSVFFSFSQTDETLVKAGSKGLYIEHKVAAKESLYSLSRTYSVHPKHLAAFNGLDMSKGLNLGQSINIPLSDSNFSRISSTGKALYYKSALKQTVGGISAITKTSADNIRQWNNLSNDIAANSPVIVGYLSTQGETPSAANTTTSITETKAEEKKEIVADQKPKQDDAKNVAATKSETVTQEPKATIKEETSRTINSSPINIAGDGYFKIHFAQQIKTTPLSKDETVTSGVFKTVNGVNEGKYYALLDGVEPGTIIRVINPSNNKAVYAKVLGQMNGIHQNEGLNLRISNAAASMLDINETDKFIVKVNY